MVKTLKYCIVPLSMMFQGWVYADSLSAADALRQLIERQPNTSTTSKTSDSTASSSVPGAPTGRRKDQAKTNETLDHVIRRTWPGLPTKEVWLRKAFVELNPQAFVQGNPNLMVAGASLTIPSQADLRSGFAASHPAIAALFGPSQVDDKEHREQDSPKASSQWVRFP